MKNLMINKLIIFFLILIMLDTALATTIHGTIYDISFNRVSDVRVEINTQPKQFIVSKDSTYSFNVPIGNYKIKAEYFKGDILESSVEENISVVGDGDYILDLILFPNFEEEEELSDVDIDIPLENNFKTKPNYLIYFLIIIFIIILILFYFKRKKVRKEKKEIKEKEEKTVTEKNSEEMSEDLKNILKIIKEQGGRTTQKEIRKKIPLSEAKISLLVAELEDKGLVEKIKKGRGNIIILR